MLQLKGISQTMHASIEFDFYVPINIEFEPWEAKTEQHFYWRAGKFLEIGINPTSKAISSFTLLIAKKVYFEKKHEIFTKNNIQIGLPLFDTNKWHDKKHFLDEDRDRDFEVYIKENSIIIILVPHRIELQIINNRVVFGFDKDNFLCTIEVKDMTSAEKALLEESLRAKNTE